MTLEATRPTLVSDLLKYEDNANQYAARAVETLTVDPEAATQPAEIGCVYQADGSPLTKAEAAALTGGEVLSVLIDDAVYTDKTAAARDLAVLKGSVGASTFCVVAREQLKSEGEAAYSAAELDLIASNLGDQGIAVRNQY